jgi:hypothetical protein
MASSFSRLPTPRSALIRTGLLGILVPICSLPAGQAMAVTFSRDPAANGWTKVGNSNSQATTNPNSGGWAAGSTTANFDIYSTRFILDAADTVSAPSAGTANGDCYLASGGARAGGCPTTSGSNYAGNNTWQAGDTVIGFGMKWASGQKGSGATQVSFDPLGTSGFTAGTAFTSPGTTSFSGVSSDGSFNFNFYPDINGLQNQGIYETYRVNPAAGNTNSSSGSIYNPYGALNANTNNLSTVVGNGTGPMNGTLPMRVFGNNNDGGWDYYTVYLNQSLMQRNGKGEAVFSDQAKWVVVANQSGGSSITASGPLSLSSVVPPSSGVPGPLPLLGAGAAFGWSRRLRLQIKPRSTVAAKSSI